MILQNYQILQSIHEFMSIVKRIVTYCCTHRLCKSKALSLLSYFGENSFTSLVVWGNKHTPGTRGQNILTVMLKDLFKQEAEGPNITVNHKRQQQLIGPNNIKTQAAVLSLLQCKPSFGKRSLAGHMPEHMQLPVNKYNSLLLLLKKLWNKKRRQDKLMHLCHLVQQQPRGTLSTVPHDHMYLIHFHLGGIRHYCPAAVAFTVLFQQIYFFTFNVCNAINKGTLVNSGNLKRCWY